MMELETVHPFREHDESEDSFEAIRLIAGRQTCRKNTVLQLSAIHEGKCMQAFGQHGNSISLDRGPRFGKNRASWPKTKKGDSLNLQNQRC